MNKHDLLSIQHMIMDSSGEVRFYFSFVVFIYLLVVVVLFWEGGLR